MFSQLNLRTCNAGYLVLVMRSNEMFFFLIFFLNSRTQIFLFFEVSALASHVLIGQRVVYSFVDGGMFWYVYSVLGKGRTSTGVGVIR